MRPNLNHLEHWRVTHPILGRGEGRNGFFVFDDADFFPSGELNPAGLKIISSVGMGWEHVSVSRHDRCPTWPEMDWVKNQFWLPIETVMQLHVPPCDHVNNHPYCLHLWRPRIGNVIPRPPKELV